MAKTSRTEVFTISGIRTNNLKGFNIAVQISRLTAVTGVSGGGKSSLAYGTIFSICKQQFTLLDTGSFDGADHIVDSFSGPIPAIAVAQSNFNSNPHSTIYSYLDLASYIYATEGAEATVKNSLLRLNRPGNECKACNGTRERLQLSKELIIDETITLGNNPFKCWSGANLAKHTTLLKEYCAAENIDTNKKFSQITPKQQEKLLYGESSQKFKISFQYAGKRRSRSEEYVGPLRTILGFEHSNKPSEYSVFEKFSNKLPCQDCNSTGLDREAYSKSIVAGINFFDLLQLPISDIITKRELLNSRLTPALSSMFVLLETLHELGLGYLALTRQIPTLSGGELQKLRFSQICNSPLTGVLFVLDEISSQVSRDSHDLLISKIKKVCQLGNTVVMIDHNSNFIAAADEVICIGPYPGERGGYLTEHTPTNEKPVKQEHNSLDVEFFSLPNVTRNNIHNLAIKIPERRVTGICGKSGSGKSSFAVAINEALPEVFYVSQKQLRGNTRSTIATALDMSNQIAINFSRVTKKDVEWFLPQQGKIGCCEVCGGTGSVDFARTFERTIKITCPACEGLLFSKTTDQILAHGTSIKKFYATPLHAIENIFLEANKRLTTVVGLAKALGISHLSFHRKIGTLSGGESRRIKLIQALVSPNKNKILIIDEPGAGLDPTSAIKAISHIASHAEKFKAILVIDHKPEVLTRCHHLLEFGPGAGPDGGQIIFQGNPSTHPELKDLF